MARKRNVARKRKRRALVTGGAGFVGSHLCGRLLAEGYRVVCVDNLLTGSVENLDRFDNEPDFQFLEQDVGVPAVDGAESLLAVSGGLEEVYHFASPASPADFARIPVEILEVNAFGTHNCLQLARARGATLMLASTSEVYGDPLVHPQKEDYWGNVNPIGERGVYDEAKRYAEALVMAYHRRHGVETRIVRIFNTYGPYMRPDDGRMIPNFINQALSGEPITVYGSGKQTRSIQYVDDLVEGVFRLMQSKERRPVNIGNPVEYRVEEVARLILEITGSENPLIYEPLPQDDPKQRCADISRARESLGWEPRVGAREGLEATVGWFAGKKDRSQAGLKGAV